MQFYQFSLVYIFSYRWLTAAAAMQWIPYITHHHYRQRIIGMPTVSVPDIGHRRIQ